MFDVVEHAFLAQQAADEGQIGFLILRDQAAPGVHPGVAQIHAPLGLQLALALVVAQDGIDDLRYGQVLINPAVTAIAQECQPGFDGQEITRHSTIGPLQSALRNVAMEMAWFRIALQDQQYRLSDELAQGKMCVETEAGELQAVSSDGFIDIVAIQVRADAFDGLEFFGHEFI